MSEDFDKWYENKLLEMAVKHKAIEDLLVDYNPNNKKVIEEARKKEGEKK
tara:strand:+ start:187 stop:336 length:150 start_codon:yes stop_codon:yes gene_type:complete